MESLLRWGIENSAPRDENAPEVKPQEFDPELIDAILGKPDTVLMKEAMDVAADRSKDLEQRMVALDNLEMLIESIDNANNLTPLQLWPPLFDLLKTDDDAILSAALWVCGTAVQNNPKAQNEFLALDPLPLLLSIIASSGRKASTRSKAVYTLSGSINHNADAIGKMGQAGGWAIMKDALVDPDITVRRKIAFLLNSLLAQDGPRSTSPEQPSTGALSTPHIREQIAFKNTTTEGRTRAAMQSSGIFDTLIKSISPGNGVPHGADGDGEADEDYTEKVVRCLSTYVEGPKPGSWTAKQKEELGKVFEGRDGEAVGLSAGEWQSLKDSVR